MAELMTLQEVADYLRVTEKTIYRLLTRGSIPATKVGRQWRFNRASIDDWLQQNSAGVRASILVVDDEDAIRALFKETLEELGHRVMVAGNGSEGLELAKKEYFDLIFLELKMPEMDGVELLRRIKSIRPRCPVPIITGYPDIDMMARALAQGSFGMMKKPFGEQDITATVSNFLGINSVKALR